MTIKIVSNADSGDANHVGGNDWDNMITAVNMGESYNYLITKSGSTFYAKNSAGELLTSNANGYTVINAAIDALDTAGDGGIVYLRNADYGSGTVNMKSYTVLKGQSMLDTKLDTISFSANPSAFMTLDNFRCRKIVVDTSAASFILSTFTNLRVFGDMSTNGLDISGSGNEVTTLRMENVHFQDHIKAITTARVCDAVLINCTTEFGAGSAIGIDNCAGRWVLIKHWFEGLTTAINQVGSSYLTLIEPIFAGTITNRVLQTSAFGFVPHIWYQSLQDQRYGTSTVKYPDFKKTGTWQGGYSPTAATSGILGGSVNTTGTEGVATIAANGFATTYDTTTASGSNAGIRWTGYSAINMFFRDQNPRGKWRFHISGTSSCRLYIGMVDGFITLTGDDPLASLNGVLFGKRASDTTWQMMTNDGSGGTTFTDTSVSVDTNIHTIEIFADNTNSRYGWILDGGSFDGINIMEPTYITSNIPASGTTQQWVAHIQNSTGVSRVIGLYYFYCELDR